MMCLLIKSIAIIALIIATLNAKDKFFAIGACVLGFVVYFMFKPY